MKKAISFSYNWNKKLECDAYTTLRLSNRLKEGDKVEVFLNQHFMHYARVIEKKKLSIQQIRASKAICYLDTGKSPEETINLLTTMYKNSDPPVDWSSQPVYWYLFAKCAKEDQLELQL